MIAPKKKHKKKRLLESIIISVLLSPPRSLSSLHFRQFASVLMCERHNACLDENMSRSRPIRGATRAALESYNL